MSPTLLTNKKSGQQSSAGNGEATMTNGIAMNTGRRKLSTRSKSHGKGLLSRRHSKAAGSTDTPPERAADTQDVSGKGADKDTVGQNRAQEQQQQQQQQRANILGRSIIPDPLAELPSWYTNDADWASSSAAQFRAKYPIHNRAGPRYYRNHHLLSPLDTRRPPSIFSPAFPPMYPTAELTQDPAKMSGPSRTPSGSPLPTPNSSQVRIHDVKGRPRKISQSTAHDDVDMLDATDPWGTNWHHRSPYDLGVDRERPPDSPESPSAAKPRSRRTSLSAPVRHKTTIPSPLSQSTSAVHLASDPLSSHLPRRLSKSRKPFRGLFGGSSESTYKSHSMPVTPMEHSNALNRKQSRAGSVVPASISSSSASLAPTEKRAKRGSILGRLARRFSVLRRSNTSPSSQDNARSARQSLSADTHAGDTAPLQSQRPPVERVKSSELPKRVPPPSAEGEATSQDAARRETSDAQSIASVDAPASPAKLHVANPDATVGSPLAILSPIPTMPLPPTSREMGPRSSDWEQRILEAPIRRSPSPVESNDYHRPPYTALSVISEGETYISTPGMRPITTSEGSPKTPPTIPSLLSLPLRATVASSDQPEPPSSPPLPDLPPPTPMSMLAPSLPPPTPVSKGDMSLPPPTPVSKGTLSLPPPTPVSKGDLSLPPTPTSTNSRTPSPTPIARPVALPQVALTQEVAYATYSERTPTSTAPTTDSIFPSDASISNNYRRAPYADGDFLSRMSMIVNPPTPFAPPLIIPPSPPAHAPSAQAQGHDGQSPRDHSPKKDGTQRVRSRHTETFKLVRSNSSEVGAAGQGFVVEGEHWEVVESPVSSSPTKRKKSERVDTKKAESSSDDSDPQRRQSTHRKSTSANDRRLSDSQPSPLPVTRARSTDAPRRSTSPERRRSKDKHSPVEGVRSTRTPIIYAPRVPASSPTPPVHSTTGFEPRYSPSTRPSSEFQPTADLNTLRAKDAWEMERMWKGRSVIYGTEAVPAPVLHPHIGSDSSTIMSADLRRASTIPSMGDLASSVSPNHGSSHTYFVVQTPYQSPPHSASYPQYPAPPPPVIYGASPTQSHSAPSSSNHQQSTRHRSFSDTAPFPGITAVPDLPMPRPNPLPELPRMSTYKAPPLPPSLASVGNAATT